MKIVVVFLIRVICLYSRRKRKSRKRFLLFYPRDVCSYFARRRTLASTFIPCPKLSPYDATRRDTQERRQDGRQDKQDDVGSSRENDN